jgi:hypothetical protein
VAHEHDRWQPELVRNGERAGLEAGIGLERKPPARSPRGRRDLPEARQRPSEPIEAHIGGTASPAPRCPRPTRWPAHMSNRLSEDTIWEASSPSELSTVITTKQNRLSRDWTRASRSHLGDYGRQDGGRLPEGRPMHCLGDFSQLAPAQHRWSRAHVPISPAIRADARPLLVHRPACAPLPQG